MRGDEERVVDAFCRWLQADGWDVQREVSWADVVAQRDGLTLYAEAKGRTSSLGLDVDTLYGQLLRRMTGDDNVRYGVVVPSEAAAAACRVSPEVRQLLSIDVYEVAHSGEVRRCP